MRLSAPICLRPDPSGAIRPPGFYVSEPASLPSLSPVTTWVQAAVVIDAAAGMSMPDRNGWVSALCVTVVTEPNQYAYTRRVFRAPVLTELDCQSGRGAEQERWGFEFALDVAEYFASGLPSEPYYLHLSTRFLHSDPQRREHPGDDKAALKEPEFKSGDSLSRLVVAYDHCRFGNFARAVEHFTVALRDQAARGDLARSNLYNAACAASLAAENATGHDSVDRLVEKAIAWLEEDFAHGRDALVTVCEQLAGTPNAEERRWLLGRRTALLAHLDDHWSDPDLDFIRAHSLWRERTAAIAR